MFLPLLSHFSWIGSLVSPDWLPWARQKVAKLQTDVETLLDLVHDLHGHKRVATQLKKLSCLPMCG